MLDLQSEIFSTDAVPRGQRLTYWNNVATTTFGDMVVDSSVPDFSAQLQRCCLGALTLATITSAPACVRGGASSAQHDWFLLLNQRGLLRTRQRGRTVVLGASELTALRADEDYCIEFAARNQAVVLRMPTLPDRVDLDKHIAVRHGVDESPLLLTFMRTLAAMDRREFERIDFRSLARTAIDLAALSWPTTTIRSPRQSMARWAHRARTSVAHNLSNPDLDAAALARELGVSTRFVHLIFQHIGQTASAFILERRLELVAKLLRANAETLITDVALCAGFSDLSAFSRAFRRHFGCSPRAWRAATLHS